MTVAPPEIDRDRMMLLEGVSWTTYVTMREELDRAGSHVRLTYDAGRLELMVTGEPHERIKSLLGELICVCAMELDLDLCGVGETTWQDAVAERGLEADQSYRLGSHAPDPPDLAIEIEMSRSAMNKLGIYGSLKVPEVWRVRRGEISVHLRTEAGGYVEASRSRCLPDVPVAWLEEALSQDAATRRPALLRAFRARIRTALRAGGAWRD